MKSAPIILFVCINLLLHPLFSQTPCSVQNSAFSSGEELEFKIIYNWGVIWLESGQVTFSVRASQLIGRKCYQMIGNGGTFSKYDWFYKVRDQFECFVDSATFRPLRFKASISEGSKNEKHDYFFDNISKKVFTSIQRGKAKTKVDTLKIGDCTIDVLTAIYYARNLDYSSYKVNDTIGLSLLLDNKIYPLYVRYLGKAVLDTKNLGKFNCIKFSPLLVEGTIFRGGEGMIVWVTDDKNKIPLYVESPIIIGTIKVKLMSYKGLKNPEDAKIK